MPRSLTLVLSFAASVALAAAASPGAVADGGHSHAAAATAAEHGMTEEEHARLETSGAHDRTATTTRAPAAGHDHTAPTAPAVSRDHGASAAPASRPAALVLGVFALLNGLVLAYAAVARRRPSAVKRREMLARVRAAAGAHTVVTVPTPGREP